MSPHDGTDATTAGAAGPEVAGSDAPKPPVSPDREAESLRAQLAEILSADNAQAVEQAEALTARIESILDSRAS